MTMDELRARAAAYMTATGMTEIELSRAVLGYTRLVPFFRGSGRGIGEQDRAALAAYLDANEVAP